MAIQKPTLSIFTGSKNLGTVITEQHQLNTKFTEFTLPFSQEEGNTAFNWKGKVRTILIQGFNSGEGFDGVDANDRLGDFVFEIEEWIRGAGETGNIQAAKIFTSSFGGAVFTWNVKCFDWTWQRSFSDPNRINYSLLLRVV